MANITQSDVDLWGLVEADFVRYCDLSPADQARVDAVNAAHDAHIDSQIEALIELMREAVW